MGSGPTRSAIKERRIRREIRRSPPRWVKLFEDETDLRLSPPPRAAWGLRGRPSEVPISGSDARRAVFGTIDIDTGHRLFLVRTRQEGEDFRAFLPVIRSHYRGWHVAPLPDEDSGPTAAGSQELAAEMGIRLIWLPKRRPERNGRDHPWGHGKDHVCANRPYSGIDDEAERFVDSLRGLSNREALRQAGILSEDFWLGL